MTGSLKCWKCGASLENQPLPVGRLDACPECGNYLHVCRMCLNYDANTIRKCREQDAEEVKDKTHTNFCDYFKPSPVAYDAGTAAKTVRAKSALDALFGGEASGEKQENLPDPLDDLFRKDS